MILMLKMLILVTSLNIIKKLMSNAIVIKNKIKQFDNKIIVGGDKSISIRWVLFASLANGNSIAKNLLISEDVKAAIKTIRKLGMLIN